MTEPTDRAEAVIELARSDHYAALGEGAAAFDYGIAGNNPLAEDGLRNATFRIANPELSRYLAGEEIDGYSPDACQARADELAGEIVEQLDAYRVECKARKYVGWSNYSAGPIEYADES